MIYIIISIILLILVLVGDNEYSFFFAFLLITILSAFRSYTVGTDTETYVNIFKGSESYFRDIEPGYALTMQMVRWITNEPQAFLFVSSLLIFLPVYIFIRNNSSNKIYSLLLFVILFNYYFSLSAIRQAIAASMILLALDYLKRDQLMKFGVLILIAASFHTTAIMMLPICFLFYKIDVKASVAIGILLVSFCIGWFELISIRGAVTLLEHYSVGGGLIDVSKYNTYAEYSFGDSKNNINAKIFNMVPNTLVCLTLLILSKKHIDFYSGLFWLGTILINIFVDIPIAFRVAYYLTFMQIILIPNTFRTSVYRRMLFISFTIAFFALFSFETYKKTVFKLKNPLRNDVVPYQMF